jgi:hypothetical protein
LIGDSFRESLGEGQRYTDDRMRIIESEGQITPRALSKKDCVSTAMISQWLEPLIEKGVLSWCDEKGHGFMDVADLEKAKRSGRAYLKVAGGRFLPTVFEITGDKRKYQNGEYWELYYLGIEESDRDVDDSTVLPEIKNEDFIEEKSEPQDDDKAVKVLSEKTGLDDNFQNDNLDSKIIPARIDNLGDEFRGLLQMN